MSHGPEGASRGRVCSDAVHDDREEFDAHSSKLIAHSPWLVLLNAAQAYCITCLLLDALGSRSRVERTLLKNPCHFGVVES